VGAGAAVGAVAGAGSAAMTAVTDKAIKVAITDFIVISFKVV
jgi:hypothetical protein